MSNIMDSKEIITTSLLEKNGFEFSHERCEGFECYHKEFNGEVDIDLIHYENPNTEWLLEIMFNNSEQELVKFVSTVEELQKCLDVMDIDIEIKY